MSSLTDEQRKRIEENRARALARLAEKKSSARSQYQNCAATSRQSTSANNTAGRSHSSYNNKPHASSNALTNQNLSRFAYRGSSSKNVPLKTNSCGNLKTSAHSQSTFSKSGNDATKSVSNAFSKARVIKGTCVLLSKTRFKVVVGFHAKLIGVLKTIPSKCYGKFNFCC